MRKLYSDGVGFVMVRDSMGTDLTPCNAARVSFAKRSETLDEKARRITEYCHKNGHVGVFEHNTVSFEMKVPLFIARQFMRHRTFSYNEVSRRYTEADLEFYMPSVGELRAQAKDNKQASVEGGLSPRRRSDIETLVKSVNRNLPSLYNQVIKLGLSREQARMLLPQSMYCHFWMTGSLRNWMHFIELRDHSHAQWEAQVAARAIKEEVTAIWPELCGIIWKEVP
jgi:thymidylate synthase (FAD)